MKKQGEIEVSKKTLLHISEGIYRTVGSSIKELISNAFDANATAITINTNYPSFDILTCQDNGEGMTEVEFLRIVQGGIGDSKKAEVQSHTNRPLIGKLGIGILAIAQVCRSFTIISHHKNSKSAFKGKMIFRTDVDKVAKEKSLKNDSNGKNYQIGRWEIEEKLEYDENKKGVLIFTNDLRQSYIKRFKEHNSIIEAPKNFASLEFDKLLEYFNKNIRAIKELGPYYELIWELCQLTPVSYYSNTPIRNEILNKLDIYEQEESGAFDYKNALEFLDGKNKEIENFNFSVSIDDIKLYRAIKLPTPLKRGNKLQECQLFYFEYENYVRKRKLKFNIYIFAQESAVKPRDLKGVQIRIKNVGIGLYDPTFMKYDKIESPRDNWMSGEIYVEEGLDSALNIDRDSFNENDEHYFILRQELHNFLKDTVFPTISSLQRKRTKDIHQKRDKKLLAELEIQLILFFKKYCSYKVQFVNEEHDAIMIKNANTIIISQDILVGPFNKRLQYFSNSILDLLLLLKSPYRNKDKKNAVLNEFSSLLLH